LIITDNIFEGEDDGQEGVMIISDEEDEDALSEM